mmetsp:Transcript_63404/g.71753  ORF Transcript_63404/g.71753 Transcript_63404/m.71753 type:complete len:652 (-) Transcript_63404:160-2115(-)
MTDSLSQPQQQQQRPPPPQQEEEEEHAAELPLHFQSATMLAAKIRRREVTSLQVTDLYIQRIQELDHLAKLQADATTESPINAVVVRCFAPARARAKQLDYQLQIAYDSQELARAANANAQDEEDIIENNTILLDAEIHIRPLHGVPMTVKENNDVSGLRTTIGNPKNQTKAVATETTPAVQRLLDAGAIIIGKTNVPIGCNDVQTYNAIWGTTSNPYDVSRTPGGSSGGSAAAICAGFSALEVGGDIGGSIRLPAALCGIFGHKTTLGAIPMTYGPSRTPDIVVKGPMARTAADLDLAVQLMVHCEGPVHLKRAWGTAGGLTLPPPVDQKEKLSDFRVAIWEDDTCCPVDTDVKNTIKNIGDKLRTMGCHPTYDRPLQEKYGWDGGSAHAFEVYKCLLASEENVGLHSDEVEAVRKILLRHKERKQKNTDNKKNGATSSSMTVAEEKLLTQWEKMQHEKTDENKKEEELVCQQADWITQSTQSWHHANMARQQMRVTYEKFFESYDVVICPITTSVAWPKDESGSGWHEWEHSGQRVRAEPVRTPLLDEDNTANQNAIVQPFWQIGKRIIPGANGHETIYHDQVFWSGVTNICGNPSTVFPAGRATSKEGNHLPVGLQIVGAEWNDRTTIAFAKALEEEVGCVFVPPQGY